MFIHTQVWRWKVCYDPLKNGPEWYVTCVTPCMRCYKLRLNLDFLMGSSLAFLQSHETPGYPNMGVIELWNLLDSVSQHTLHRILCLRLCISEEWRNSIFTMGSNQTVPLNFRFCKNWKMLDFSYNYIIFRKKLGYRFGFKSRLKYRCKSRFYKKQLYS